MKRSELLFESPPRLTFWGRRSHWWQTGMGAVVLCALLVLLFQLLGKIWQGHLMTQELDRQSQHLSSLTRQTPKPSKPSPSGSRPASDVSRGLTASAASELSEDERRQLNRVIQQLNTPWQDLFQQLERSTPQEVALISIEPDANRASVKLQAEARSLDVLLSYAASLQFEGVLGALTYSKHETNDQDPNKPIRLSFELGLRPPARLTAVAVEVPRPASAAPTASAPSRGKP